MLLGALMICNKVEIKVVNPILGLSTGVTFDATDVIQKSILNATS